MPQQIERLIEATEAKTLSTENLSQPHRQRLRWQVQADTPWTEFHATWSRELAAAGFRVETTHDSLSARMATETDSYLIELRRLPASVNSAAQIELIGSPF